MPLPTVPQHPAIKRLLDFFEFLVESVTVEDSHELPQLKTVKFRRHGTSNSLPGIHIRLEGGSGKFKNSTEKTYGAEYDNVLLTCYLPVREGVTLPDDARLFMFRLTIEIPVEHEGKLRVTVHTEDYLIDAPNYELRSEIGKHIVLKWHEFFGH